MYTVRATTIGIHIGPGLGMAMPNKLKYISNTLDLRLSRWLSNIIDVYGLHSLSTIPMNNAMWR